MSAVLERLQVIEVERPADLAFRQLRRLIVDGVVQPGDALPSERHLAERFGLSRIHVREALQRLEFCGLVRMRPQSGTVVSSTDIRALDGLFENILAFDRDDLAALLETRAALEIQAARLAATRATDEEIADLRATMDAFRAEVRAGNTGIEHDLMFHRKLAEASRNRVMRSLVGVARARHHQAREHRPDLRRRALGCGARRARGDHARDRGARRRRGGEGHGGALRRRHADQRGSSTLAGTGPVPGTRGRHELRIGGPHRGRGLRSGAVRRRAGACPEEDDPALARPRGERQLGDPHGGDRVRARDRGEVRHARGPHLCGERAGAGARGLRGHATRQRRVLRDHRHGDPQQLLEARRRPRPAVPLARLRPRAQGARRAGGRAHRRRPRRRRLRGSSHGWTAGATATWSRRTSR